MKKVFTLFAAAVLGLCAYAQPEGPCPSRIYFEPAEAEQPANNAMFLVKLENSSMNLNGFNMQVQKPEAAEWVQDAEDGEWVGFSGYGHVILARWDGVTDNQREQKLFQKCHCNCGINSGKLVIIELLKTNDCRFFPILTTEDDNTIARFTVDFSACEDTQAKGEPLVLFSEATPEGCSFSYTGGEEGTVAWTIDAPIELKLDKVDGIIREYIETGISTIDADQQGDNRIFDLQGRELNRVPESGIYIQNGKKYVK